jgi:hypothetical protein
MDDMTDDPDKINPDKFDDPASPPPGYRAIDCPECAETSPKSGTPRMALGPIPGVSLGANQTTSLCRRCRGRRWVWYKRAVELN